MSGDAGGPAFPGQYDHGHTVESWVGMTLRDYFAAKAIEAMDLQIAIAKPAAKSMALSAYLVADAMLEARQA